MPRDPTEIRLEDRRIDIDHEPQVRYWCERFGVSPWELKAAVKRVGPIADVVAKALQAFTPTG